MKKLTYLLVFICLASCTVAVPIVNSYQETPFVAYSDKSKDEVWSKVIDVFAQKGLTISIIDKSSGLITSNDYSFTSSVTYEMMNGMLKDTTAWIVVGKRPTDTQYYTPPNNVRGSFNVRVKEEAGKTAININLVGLTAMDITQPYNTKITYQVKSTGVFERTFAEMVK